MGSGLFVPDDEDEVLPQQDTSTRVVQGQLEGSNSGAVEQMVHLIEQERMYTFTQQALSLQDENLGRAVGDLRPSHVARENQMIRALHSAASGMFAQQLNIDNIANNLANVNTAGFKKSRAEFQDLLYQNLRTGGMTNSLGNVVPTELQIGTGVRTVAVTRNMSQGSVVQTGNVLDLAIEGEGFFQVTRLDGTIAYTRDGSMQSQRMKAFC